MRDWQKDAPRIIGEVHKANPDATPAELRKLLRAQAGNFHGGTSWGQKVWSKHCRIYIARLTDGAPLSPTVKWPDDIVFPFRGLTDTGSGADIAAVRRV